MSLLGTMAAVSNAIQAGGAAASLISLTKTFISSPGISVSLKNSRGVFPHGVNVFGQTPNLHVITSDRVRNRAEVTDHYTEANSFFQDHIAFQPTYYTVAGEVGELVWSQSTIERYVQAVLDRLGPLNIISPELSLAAERYLATYNQLQQSIVNAANIASDIAGMFGISALAELGFGLSAQQKCYQFFDSIYQNRIAVTVDTPWKTFESMIIESFEFEQGEETADKSQVTVTFKEFRTVQSLDDTGPLLGKIADQAAKVEEKGVSKGTSSPTSVLEDLKTFFLKSMGGG